MKALHPQDRGKLPPGRIGASTFVAACRQLAPRSSCPGFASSRSPFLLKIITNFPLIILFKVFSVHQRASGSFLFTEKLCALIQVSFSWYWWWQRWPLWCWNRSYCYPADKWWGSLSCPLPHRLSPTHGKKILWDQKTIAAQVCVRSLRRVGQPYTYCHLCCGALMVVALPWILAIITYTIPEAPGIHHGGSIKIVPSFISKRRKYCKIRNSETSSEARFHCHFTTDDCPLLKWRKKHKT